MDEIATSTIADVAQALEAFSGKSVEEYVFWFVGAAVYIIGSRNVYARHQKRTGSPWWYDKKARKVWWHSPRPLFSVLIDLQGNFDTKEWLSLTGVTVVAVVAVVAVSIPLLALYLF